MTKSIFLILFLVITTFSNAQSTVKSMEFEIVSSHDFVSNIPSIPDAYVYGGFYSYNISIDNKYGFGLGCRLNGFVNHQLSPTIGLIIADRGYVENLEGEDDTGPISTRRRPKIIYLSIPLGAKVYLSKNHSSLYLVPSLVTDILLFQDQNLNRINTSISLGIGRSFSIGRNFSLLIEPNFKLPLESYGQIALSSEIFSEYKPCTFGIHIGIKR